LGGGLHHARRSFASGFCIYNDLAIAINSLTRSGLKVAYLDIDVHHGDGVQQILYEDPRVLTVSVHESGKYLFPGTGEIRELGSGAGRGLKLNLPLEPFTEGESYLEVVEQVIPPALRHFRPDVLVVQAGADAHFDDPLSDLMLTTRDYEAIFRRILGWADDFTAGRVLFTLGGGYSFRAVPRVWAILYLVVHDLDVARDLPESWRSTWSRVSEDELPQAFHDPNPSHADIPNRYEIAHRNRQVAERLLDLTRQYWFPK
ncbi:MAG: acetoin utilization protein AcuC, partial [Acidobacteriota bacterium]